MLPAQLRASVGSVTATHTHHPGDDHAALLDLDALVLGGYLDELVGWTAALAPAEVRTVVDVGAGTGVGTIALARRFGGAEVVAVDRSAEMLHRAAVAASSAGLAGRVRTVPADLDEGWPSSVERADVVWASSSLHEVADPDRLLRDILAALPPDGLLVVVEIDGLPQVLPEDVADGLGERSTAALLDAGWNSHPDWRAHLERAGLEVVDQRTVVSGSSADAATTSRFARAWLGRMRGALERRLPGDDLAVLDRLLADTGPGAVLDRPDLPVRGSRTAWAARRPLLDHESGGSR
jgi:ubiquinone/menaquinone biosynthesis C-methylase UbiE